MMVSMSDGCGLHKQSTSSLDRGGVRGKEGREGGGGERGGRK